MREEKGFCREYCEVDRECEIQSGIESVSGSVGAELREDKGDHLEFKERSRRILGESFNPG